MAAGLTVMLLLPLTSHSLEFAVHYLGGTPKLGVSILSSVCFTGISTLFNLFAMRRGVLIVGNDSATVTADMRQIPLIIALFAAAGAVAAYRGTRALLAGSAAARPNIDQDFAA